MFTWSMTSAEAEGKVRMVTEKIVASSDAPTIMADVDNADSLAGQIPDGIKEEADLLV